MSQKAGSAEPLVPADGSLSELREAAAGCQACDLWKTGTQTVFGEGEPSAAVMLIGEQPGDYEDRAGHPFVGPAGRVLDEALEAAGIDRARVYVTNAVKHFKWQARGRRRIHERPNWTEMNACRPWLEAEIASLRPAVIVCLGATAAQTLLGKQFRVSVQRGQLISSPHARYVMATVHPSSILRAPDDESRQAQMYHFIKDLKLVRPLLP